MPLTFFFNFFRQTFSNLWWQMPHRGTTRLDICQTNVLVLMGRGEQGGGNGHTWNEGSHRLHLMTFATATSLQSVFFGYAKKFFRNLASKGTAEENLTVKPWQRFDLHVNWSLITERNMQPRSQGSLLPGSRVGRGRREHWERGCEPYSTTPRQNVYACARLSISSLFFSHTFQSDQSLPRAFGFILCGPSLCSLWFSSSASCCSCFDYFVVIEISFMDNQAQITETISRLDSEKVRW